MNNDLISRETLNDIWELYERYQPSLATNVLEFGDALKDIIDNAPTVEVGYLTNCANCERVEKIRAKRPHGKWIDHWSEDLQKQGYRQCSNCKAGCQIYDHGTRKSEFPWIDGHQYTLQRIRKYCPNCGAKMDKEG